MTRERETVTERTTEHVPAVTEVEVVREVETEEAEPGDKVTERTTVETVTKPDK